MLANFLGKSKPINFIILLSLFTCLFLCASFSQFSAQNFNLFSLLKIAGFLGFYFSVFFFYNFIVSKNNLTFDNFYAFFIFTILLSYFLPIIISFKSLITLLLYTLFLRKIYSLKSHKKTLKKLFDSGFWLGVLFLINPFTAIFSILIYSAIFLHQKAIIHNLLTPIIGFLIPGILYCTHCLWFDQLYLFTNLFYFEIPASLSFYADTAFYWTTISILGLSLLSLIVKSPKALSINNSFKKSWLLLMLNLSVGVLFALIVPNKNGVELLFLALPATIIIANGIELIASKFIKNLFFIVLLASAFGFPFLL
jgi:hypothetical protein